MLAKSTIIGQPHSLFFAKARSREKLLARALHEVWARSSQGACKMHTCVDFALVGAILQAQLLPGVPVPVQLCSQGSHDVMLPLDPLLSPLDVLDDALVVAELCVPLPEALAVVLDLCLCLAIYFLGNICNGLPSILQYREGLGCGQNCTIQQMNVSVASDGRCLCPCCCLATMPKNQLG